MSDDNLTRVSIADSGRALSADEQALQQAVQARKSVDSRIVGGTHRSTVDPGGLTILEETDNRPSGVVRASTEDLRVSVKGILGTARDQHSQTPVAPSNVTPETLVEVGGQTMQAKTAIQLGYLSQSGDGTIFDPAVGPQTPTVQPPTDQQGDAPVELVVPEDSAAYLGEDQEKFIAAAMNNDPEVYGEAVNAVVSAVVAGEKPDFDFARIGEATEMSTMAASGGVAAVMDSFQQQADKVAYAAGVESADDMQEFYNYARQDASGQMGEAIRRLIDGDLDGWQALARTYVTARGQFRTARGKD